MLNKKASDKLLMLSGRQLVVSKDWEGNVCVHYDYCDVPYSCGYSTLCGRGRTFEEACEEYCDNISGKTIVFNLGCSDEKRVQVLF
jgi:hypothetical protein